MAKTSVSSVVPGQVGDIQRAAALEADERQLREPQQAPAPAPRGLQSLIEPTLAAESAPEAMANLSEGITAGLEAQFQREGEIEAQREQNEIAPLKERAMDPSVRAGQWETPAGKKRPPMPETYGGIFTRANELGGKIETGAIRPRLGTENMRAAALERGDVNQLAAAAEVSGALVNNTFDPDFAKMGSIVTENMIANIAEGKEEEGARDAIAEALGEEPAQPKVNRRERAKITKATQNERLGQAIHAEYSRMKNVREGKNPDQYEPLSKEQALVLGDAFKETWAAANPDLVKRFTTPGGQSYFQLTDAGESAMTASAQIRKRMFPTVNVRPTKTPAPQGRQVGDVGRQTKPWSGKVGDTVGADVLKQAVFNMSTVPNVVDVQRNKILLTTVLPILAGAQLDPTLAKAYGNIHNIGETKMVQFQAAKKDQDRRRERAEAEGETFEETDYNPDENMEALIDKVAQEVRAIQTERNGANYLTYGIQGFNGRVAPQQTYFDPTTSKAVRFVTRNAVPAIAKPGNRIERNLRQMYAMMLVPGADAKLPAERVRALENYAPKLRQWGQRLSEVLEQSMTDAEYEAMAQAITEGKPLNELNIKPLALDPQADAELIQAIASKKEDGPHFIDGVIDFYKFDQSMSAGRPYGSYFNAYMDGKTNGLAANGMQMGHYQTAAATGVIRDSKTDLLDDGDIRDKLKSELLGLIDNGWDGNAAGFYNELNDVAREVFSWRDLNKKTTMTFGYGKEINSFKKDIEETISLLEEQALAEPGSTLPSSLAVLDQNMDRAMLAETILGKYAVGLEQALSNDAIKSRAIMRSAAFLHALTDTLFTINSPTGYELHLGRDVSEGWETAAKEKYSLEIDGKKTSDIQVADYQTRPTSAAARNMGDQVVPGEYAYGGSLPGPVQSIDAATVALTVTGPSWKRLRQASGGNPYIHTIYDAFKADAMGFDVIFEETNKNWTETTLDWSYLEQTRNSMKTAMAEYNAEYQKDPDRVLTDQEAEFIDYFMAETPAKTSGRLYPANLMNKLKGIMHKPDGVDNEEWGLQMYKLAKQIHKRVSQAGYYAGQPVTARMRHVFYREMVNELNLANRLTGMIEKTNNNKKKLRQELARKAPPKSETLGYDFRWGAQYYAH